MLIICIFVTILAIVVDLINLDDHEIVSFFSGTGAICFGIVDLVLIVCICNYYVVGLTAKPKIKMYEEENIKIEEQLDILVKQYMEYEGNTLKEFKSNSSVTLVSLYPNLKSDALVSRQIDTYINNNNKIKELKEKEIELRIGKWLLYFGK